MAGLDRPAWFSEEDENQALILSLLEEDAAEFTSRAKGKQREGTLSDADLALQLQTEELHRAAVYASDRRMTKSMQDAVQTDTTALVESERQETVRRRGRGIATARPAGQPQALPANTGLSETELQTWEKLQSKYIKGSDKTQPEHDASIHDCTPRTSWTDNPRARHGQRLVDKAAKNSCLNELFGRAMLDDGLFPPRCCRLDIPIDTSQLFLKTELIEQFNQKSIEFSTPNKTYCHQPTCSTFIPPATIKDGVGECPKCQNKTCESCKGATHGGDCPSDVGLQQVLEIAREKGWQRCPKCFTVVELALGCYHISCNCRAQFCYLCAAPWKTCACAHWDEDRLYNRAEEIYNRGYNPDDGDLFDDFGAIPAVWPQADVAYPAGPQPAATVENREATIERIVGSLLERHACDHARWNNPQGPRRCDLCYDRMPIYIYECRQCHITACRACRLNRV